MFQNITGNIGNSDRVMICGSVWQNLSTATSWNQLTTELSMERVAHHKYSCVQLYL